MTMYQVRNVGAMAALCARVGHDYEFTVEAVCEAFGDSLAVRLMASHAYQVAASRMGAK